MCPCASANVFNIYKPDSGTFHELAFRAMNFNPT